MFLLVSERVWHGQFFSWLSRVQTASVGKHSRLSHPCSAQCDIAIVSVYSIFFVGVWQRFDLVSFLVDSTRIFSLRF